MCEPWQRARGPCACRLARSWLTLRAALQLACVAPQPQRRRRSFEGEKWLGGRRAERRSLLSVLNHAALRAVAKLAAAAAAVAASCVQHSQRSGRRRCHWLAGWRRCCAHPAAGSHRNASEAMHDFYFYSTVVQYRSDFVFSKVGSAPGVTFDTCTRTHAPRL